MYALLSWLRNLDPVNRLQPQLFLDNQRTVDGWHRRWNTLESWAPHRDLWLQVEAAREDSRDGVAVLWVKGRTLPGAAGRCKNAARRIFGNKAADALAREAASWHPTAPVVRTSMARSHVRMRQLCNAYVRLIEWAVQVPGRLPEVTPLERSFPRMRPPPIPEH